ncbi:MAG: mono/diheme cytochrome c family protein [Saprospiraceae bacterium]|jgi:mono/diheme cytochrome c family protein
MKKILIFTLIMTVIFACGDKKESPSQKIKRERKEQATSAENGLGVGEIKNVTLNDPLNQEMVKRGLAIYEMKCAACHKLKGSRVVGPSWAGMTTKRKPEWIMNMITNVEVMLDKDPTAQKLLEECMTRMPNQNVSIGDARDILEFIYQNDIDNAK